ncbi:MAG: YggT family protein [Candidatus Rokubacteria bacterium]|nr:YggT family protein [Candidatus Rokubacteria bacterium]MBI2544140.1 YggT family protein [Candidatus Rokubacteria bacterium]MBI2552868.1 YggT family protein [Candidatus Rokubacteria bacterium]
MVLYRLVDFVGLLLGLYTWVIIAAVLITWVNPDPYNPIVQFLRRVTEPVLRPIRRVLARYQGGLDFSPLVAILIIQFIQRVILPSLF